MLAHHPRSDVPRQNSYTHQSSSTPTRRQQYRRSPRRRCAQCRPVANVHHASAAAPTAANRNGRRNVQPVAGRRRRLNKNPAGGGWQNRVEPAAEPARGALLHHAFKPRIRSVHAIRARVAEAASASFAWCVLLSSTSPAHHAAVGGAGMNATGTPAGEGALSRCSVQQAVQAAAPPFNAATFARLCNGEPATACCQHARSSAAYAVNVVACSGAGAVQDQVQRNLCAGEPKETCYPAGSRAHTCVMQQWRKVAENQNAVQ